jgi:hypothetical protein
VYNQHKYTDLQNYKKLEYTIFWVSPDEGLHSGLKFGILSNLSPLEDIVGGGEITTK